MPEIGFNNGSEPYRYDKEKPLEENQAGFFAQAQSDRENSEAYDHEDALKEDVRRAVQGQDKAMAERAASGDGQALEQLYSGFFGSRENCEVFARLVPEEFYARGNTVIVDAGSSQGTLGNYMREKFQEHGSRARLIMVDTNATAMANSPVEAKKIKGDLLENPLPNESADLIILRSVLQYMGPDDQRRLLEGLYRALKPGGMLVSQFAAFGSHAQAETFNDVFLRTANRPVHFISRQEGLALHESVFGGVAEVSAGPTLFEAFDDFFVHRLAASGERIEAAKRVIGENVAALGDVLISREDPYSWEIPYTIVRCEKQTTLEA